MSEPSKHIPINCSHCMSRQVRRRGFDGIEWMLAPLAVPVMCDRCLTPYYYPTLLLGIHKLASWWKPRRSRSRNGKSKERRSTSIDA